MGMCIHQLQRRVYQLSQLLLSASFSQ